MISSFTLLCIKLKKPCRFEDLIEFRTQVLKKPTRHPLQIVVSRECAFPIEAPIFQRPDLDVLVITSTQGERKMLSLKGQWKGKLNILTVDLGPNGLDFSQAFPILREKYNIQVRLNY